MSGKANPYVTIKVPFLDAQKHMGEGDYLGSCEDAMADPEFTMENTISLPSDDKVRRDPKCLKITSGCKPKIVVSGDKVSTSVIRVNCCPPSCSQSRWLFEHCLAARF